MSKERLERIEHSAERTALLTKPPQPLVTISDSDFEWLIEQAERVQEMEEIKNDAIEQIDVTQRRNKRLENRLQELEEEIKTHAPNGRNYTNAQYITLLHENKRYREALEEIINARNHFYPTEYVFGVEGIARKALEE